MSSHLYDSHKFSQDVSRDMQIPDRIGATGGSFGSGPRGFAAESGFPAFSRIVDDMNIPDKILATGQAGSADDSPSYDPLDPSRQVMPCDVISIDSPPDTITLDRVRYPDIVRSENSDGDKPKRKRNHNSDTADSGSAGTGTAASGNLSMALLRLQKRLEALEAENEQRRKRELVLYPAIGLYFLFKIFGWILRPRRMIGGQL